MQRITDDVFEYVRITAVSDSGAKGVTRYNSEISFRWFDHLPDPAPVVGEVWLANRIYPNTWRLDNKISGSSYTSMKYALSLDARSCIGRERAITEDIINIGGINEVYLKIAADNHVMWASEVAGQFGLKVDGDHVSQLIDRLGVGGISVVFVIDCELWTSSDTEQYRQVCIDTGRVSNLLSPFICAAPVKALVDELYVMYGNKVRGVCFEHFGFDNEYADFNESNKLHYYNMYGEMPDATFVSNDLEKRLSWIEYNASMQRYFLTTIKKDIGNWPVSAIVTDNMVDISNSGMATGRLSSGIDDDFSSYGWSSVGVPLAYTRQSNKSASLRSFELMIALARRVAHNASTLFVIDISTMTEYDGVFELLAKYNANTVLINDYERWRVLSDANVIRIKDAMGKYAVQPQQTTAFVGVVLSSDSRDAASLSDLADGYPYMNKQWCKGFENMCSNLLDKLPHRITILFDSDIDEGEYYGSNAIVSFNQTNMSDDAISNLFEQIDIGINVVLLGYSGAYGRATLPFIPKFKQGELDDTGSYSDYVSIVGHRIDVSDLNYVLDDTITGVTLAFVNNEAKAILSGNMVDAPVLFAGRSSYVAFDVLNDAVVLDLIGDLALYALGRD